MTLKNIAIITAAGNGARMNNSIYKQFIEICQKPILAHTIEHFEQSLLIDEIILVVNESYVDYTKEIVKKYSYKKIRDILSGGKTRQETVQKSLKALPQEECIVLVHDGVRPFVDVNDIETIIKSVATDGISAVLAAPVKETIKEVVNNIVINTPIRERLFAIQTPQVFMSSVLVNAYNNNLDIQATDCATLVEKSGGKVRIIETKATNIKITTSEDLVYAEYIINNKR